MTSSGPFSLDYDEFGYTLSIDGSWLDGDDPIMVVDDRGPVALNRDPDLRVRLTHDEAARLWRMLDITIGTHQREGEAVKTEFERAVRAGLDTRLCSHSEYEAALRVLEDPRYDEEERAIADAVAQVYERAHGTRREST